MLSFREGSHNDASLLAGLSASEDISDLVTGKRKRKMIDYKVGHAPCETDTACTTIMLRHTGFCFQKRVRRCQALPLAVCTPLLAYTDLFLHELLRLSQLTLMF